MILNINYFIQIMYKIKILYMVKTKKNNIGIKRY